jgi:phosphatidylethanolamine-binding protein (PEBP) family uncharacterized protein
MAASSLRRARQARARARLSRIAAIPLLAAGGALAGCGTASPTASSARVPALEVSSPTIAAGKPIPVRYTCSGKDVSPPISWRDVPSNTAELALFLLALGHAKPVAGKGVEATVTVAWAVHGLKPTLHGIAAGRLPAGAITGRRRYSICPPKGVRGEYLFRLYALPAPLQLARGISDLEAFRRVNRASSAVGYLLAEYKRS